MIPKNKKIVNPSRQAKYKKNNPVCEACLYLESNYPVYQIELHHIYGGSGRTDEIWNYISLCHEHHERATTHNLRWGAASWEWNRKYLAIKLLKGEISEDKLAELKILDEIRQEYEMIVRSESYQLCIQLGWNNN